MIASLAPVLCSSAIACRTRSCLQTSWPAWRLLLRIAQSQTAASASSRTISALRLHRSDTVSPMPTELVSNALYVVYVVQRVLLLTACCKGVLFTTVSVCLQEMRDRAKRNGVAPLTWQEFNDDGRRLGAFSHGKPVSYMPPSDLNAHRAHLKPDLHRACGCGVQHGKQRDTSRPGGDYQVHPVSPASLPFRSSVSCLGFGWTGLIRCRAQARDLYRRTGILLDRTERLANSLGHLACVVSRLSGLAAPVKVS